MKLPTPYQCDECGETKLESNHWWVLLKNRYTSGENVFTIGGWGDFSPDSKTVTGHLCSDACAIKALLKWMRGEQTGQVPHCPELNTPGNLGCICLACVLARDAEKKKTIPREFSGPLSVAVRTYLESRKDSRSVTAEHVRLIRNYLRDWISAPSWDTRLDKSMTRNLRELRESVDVLKTADQIETWIHGAERTGLDSPLD